MAEAASTYAASDVLIEATSRRLWNDDESELRILDICKETNLSTSVIYGHFGSRQGLINASLLHVFALVTDELVANLETSASHALSTGSFVNALFSLLADADYQEALNRQRQMFFRVSATALSRLSIRPGFLQLYERYIERSDVVYQDLLDGGHLSKELTARQWALFFEGQMLSRAFHDLSSNWYNQDDWLRSAYQMYRSANHGIIS
ncbi:MAG: TetR/AcrR family transcriptional regulator [Acidimicrobiales bacterium]